MHHDDDISAGRPHDDELQTLFDALPRTASLEDGEVDWVVARLKREGHFAPRRRMRWPMAIAAAIALFAVGLWTGWNVGRHGSLEEMLGRNDLTVAERVLLLQRAGSAYVRAAEGYANATAVVDTGAVQVASRVLLGAAHAVARSHLDAGVASRLTNMLAPDSAARSKPTPIWF